jgi:hypothetical protein
VSNSIKTDNWPEFGDEWPLINARDSLTYILVEKKTRIYGLPGITGGADKTGRGCVSHKANSLQTADKRVNTG